MLAENTISSGFPKNTTEPIGVDIVISQEFAMDMNHYNNDPLIIIVQHDNWDIRSVLIDRGSSADVLFLNAFYKQQLNLDEM